MGNRLRPNGKPSLELYTLRKESLRSTRERRRTVLNRFVVIKPRSRNKDKFRIPGNLKMRILVLELVEIDPSIALGCFQQINSFSIVTEKPSKVGFVFNSSGAFSSVMEEISSSVPRQY